MANDKETWVAKEVDRPVETDSTPSAMAQPKKGFFEQLTGLANNILTIVVAAGLSVGGYFAYPYFNPPSFTEAQGYFTSAGDGEAGEHLAELAKVCQDGTKTKLACKLVYYAGLQELREKSQQTENVSQVAENRGGKQ